LLQTIQDESERTGTAVVFGRVDPTFPALLRITDAWHHRCLASPMLGTSHYLKEHKVLNETMDKKQTLMRSLIDELGMLE
jgi:hypothetical protein